MPRRRPPPVDPSPDCRVDLAPLFSPPSSAPFFARAARLLFFMHFWGSLSGVQPQLLALARCPFPFPSKSAGLAAILYGSCRDLTRDVFCALPFSASVSRIQAPPLLFPPCVFPPSPPSSLPPTPLPLFFSKTTTDSAPASAPPSSPLPTLPDSVLPFFWLRPGRSGHLPLFWCFAFCYLFVNPLLRPVQRFFLLRAPACAPFLPTPVPPQSPLRLFPPHPLLAFESGTDDLPVFASHARPRRPRLGLKL